ncbi:aromatic ring-hydroxylating oxygenase subunit alpha [Cryptosporangium phraense]|uniref:Aromatic ring-hydroxylating dioxygenase subunit alpha n=1 Tax=Cryptosporangium phraense TaxID=2593070 RepID=A0A545APJ8_9ACTN|nr:aromatic ring-hydroxylating dioxygenase subunit alpha [Cryptosporangium phraense]TQS43181.1 aromatic ring-hydroxylating dioxygenase subunit alpha [Cryptosporangium phraense]
MNPQVQAILNALDPTSTDYTTARTMPASVYTSEDFYAFEKEAIFAKEWLCLGHVSQVPNEGDYFTIQVADEPLIVVRGSDGAIRVMSSICQHRGYPVKIDGDQGNAKEFRCDYHYWAYNLDGQLKAAPEMTRTCPLAQLRAETQLPQLKVEIWHGMIFANMDLDAAPLAPTLTKLAPEFEAYDVSNLTLINPMEYKGQPWNWKGMHENALEPYHTSFVHMGYHDIAPASMAEFTEWDDADGQVMHPTNYRWMDAGFNPTGMAILPVFPGLSEERRKRVMFASVLPTVFFALSPEQVFYFLITPESANTMTLRMGWLFPEVSLKSPGFQWAFEMQNAVNQVINDQDIYSNTRMQDGQRSRYTKRGRYSWQEGTLPQMNRWLTLRYLKHAAELG